MTQTLEPAATAAPNRPEQRAVMTAVVRSPRSARAEQWMIGFFVVVPLLAMLAAIPVAWGWGISWHDLALFAVFYAISGHGITIGFHRYFTHGAFKAKKALRVALAVAGSMAVEGPVMRWVADHRRHHAYSDKDGDPHSP
jgi:stearoyl-CoA desaturase (delta-9 desaturase)